MQSQDAVDLVRHAVLITLTLSTPALVAGLVWVMIDNDWSGSEARWFAFALTIFAGVTMVTGHLHSLKVTPFNDYTGNRFGVDTGTLAEINGPQFMDYMEDNPANWRSGFAVLTFKDGRLLWPELVHKWDEGLVEFRGQVVDVSGY